MQTFSKEDLLPPRQKTTGEIILTALCYLFFAAGIATAAASFWMNSQPTMSGQFSTQLLVLISGGVWAFLWGAGILYAASAWDNEERERLILLEHGKFGKARILYTETDADVPGADIAVEMFLEINIEGQSPFHIKERIVISIYKLTQFKEGETLNVLIAPAVSDGRNHVIKFLDK